MRCPADLERDYRECLLPEILFLSYRHAQKSAIVDDFLSENLRWRFHYRCLHCYDTTVNTLSITEAYSRETNQKL